MPWGGIAYAYHHLVEYHEGNSAGSGNCSGLESANLDGRYSGHETAVAEPRGCLYTVS
jgi:hypothetical protein